MDSSIDDVRGEDALSLHGPLDGRDETRHKGTTGGSGTRAGFALQTGGKFKKAGIKGKKFRKASAASVTKRRKAAKKGAKKTAKKGAKRRRK